MQALSKAGHCVAVVPSFAECQPRGTQQIIFQKKNFVEKSRQVTPPVSRLLAFAECWHGTRQSLGRAPATWHSTKTVFAD